MHSRPVPSLLDLQLVPTTTSLHAVEVAAHLPDLADRMPMCLGSRSFGGCVQKEDGRSRRGIQPGIAGGRRGTKRREPGRLYGHLVRIDTIGHQDHN